MKKLILILLLVCLIPSVASAVILVRRSAVDVTAPEFSSAAIGTDGETVTINFNENVTGTENDTFTLDCAVAGDPISLTYSSGSGGTALVFTAGDVLTSTGDGESCTLDFDGDADDFEDDAGNDLADFDTAAVTNNSTQSSVTARYVNTASSSGGDGTTNATSGDHRAWVSMSEMESQNLDLTEAGLDITDYTVYCSGTSADTTAVTFAGWTLDSTHQLTIIGDNDTGEWSTSYYRLYISDWGGVAISLAGADNINFKNMQISCGSDNYKGIEFLSGSTDITFSNSIITKRGGAKETISIAQAYNVNFINCIIYRTDNTNQGVLFAYINSTCRLYNTIVTGFAEGIHANNSGSYPVLVNCAVFNNTDDFYSDSAISCDYCASDDADATTYTNGIDWDNGSTDWANNFTAYATQDFTVVDTDADIYDAGSDLSGTFTDDITGYTRSTWDIGAFEYQ